MAGHYTVINYPADSAGCGYYRMIFPKLALQTIARDIYFIESNKMIGDPTFYRDIRVVRIQRQVSNQQCQFFLKFLKPLAESLGFWLIYEIDDVIAHEDIPPYNIARDTFNKEEFFGNVKNMLEASDIITVTTPDLKDYYVGKYGILEEKFVVIPNYLPRWWIGETFNVDRQKKQYDDFIKRPRIGIPLSSSHYDMKNQNNGVDDLSHITNFIRSTHKKYLWSFVGYCPPNLVDLARSGDIEVSPASDMLNYPRELWRKNYQAVVVPLRDNVFNKCKCVVGSTKIQIQDKGIMNISDVCGKESGKFKMRNNIKCLSKNGIYEDITHYFKSDKPETVKKITTENGYEIIGTPYHKLMTSDGWKEIKNITKDDIITLEPFKLPENTPLVEVKIPCLWTKKMTLERFQKAETQDNCPILKVTEVFARLMGYVLGDGYLDANAIKISCCDRDTEVINDIKNIIESFGIDAKIRPDDRSKMSIVAMNSRSFVTLFDYLGFKGSQGRGKGSGKNLRVPPEIWKSKRSVIMNFLIGLFESDGTVNDSAIVFTTKSGFFIKEIQMLLLALGIKSRICERNCYIGTKSYGKHWYLNLQRQSVDKYYEVFGEDCFISNFKKNRVKEIIGKKHSNRYKEQPIYTDKVVSITDDGEEFVYDICVKNTECYSANGILSHNSEIKYIETAALGIPCVTQRLTPYLKYNDLLFDDANDLQNVFDNLFKDKKRYINIIKDNRQKIDYKLGDGVFSKGAWIEKNLKTWYDIYTLPQKSLKYDLRKLRGDRDGLKLEL